MSSVNSDNITLVEEKSVLCKPVDVEDASLDYLDFMLFLAMGCTAWVAWQIFMRLMKLTEQPERCTYAMPNETVDQKLRIIENLLGHVVSCKLGAKCSRDDCSDFKVELHDQLYDDDDDDDESDRSTTSDDSSSIDSNDVSENSPTSDSSNDSDDESDSSNTGDSSNDSYDQSHSSRTHDNSGDCTVSRYSRGYCSNVDGDLIDESGGNWYPENSGCGNLNNSDGVCCFKNVDSGRHLEDSGCQPKRSNLDKNDDENDYDSDSSVSSVSSVSLSENVKPIEETAVQNLINETEKTYSDIFGVWDRMSGARFRALVNMLYNSQNWTRPNAEMIKELSLIVSVVSPTIEKWFKNKRNERRQKARSSLPSSHKNTASSIGAKINDDNRFDSCTVLIDMDYRKKTFFEFLFKSKNWKCPTDHMLKVLKVVTGRKYRLLREIFNQLADSENTVDIAAPKSVQTSETCSSDSHAERLIDALLSSDYSSLASVVNDELFTNEGETSAAATTSRNSSSIVQTTAHEKTSNNSPLPQATGASVANHTNGPGRSPPKFFLVDPILTLYVIYVFAVIFAGIVLSIRRMNEK